MKTADQRVQEAIEAQTEPVKKWATRGKIRMASRDYEAKRRADVADYRVGLIAIIMLVGFVVYQVWEITQ